MLMTRESVKRALTYAIGIKGEDFVYSPRSNRRVAECLYLEPGRHCPSCIVGFVLAFHGVDLRRVEEHTGADTVLYHLRERDVLTFESEHEAEVIENALRAAQKAQDGGDTWGEAQAAALEILDQADES